MPVINNATVATGTGLSTAGNGGRKLVRLSNGNFINASKSTTSFFINKSVDNGTSWTQIYTFSYTSVQDVCVETNGDKIFVLTSFNNIGIGFNTRNADGSLVAGSSINIDSSQTALGNVSLAINEAGTELHAAWSSKNATYPNSFNIRYAKGTINGDGSVTWGAVEQVTKANVTSDNFNSPSITSQGKLVATYNSTFPANAVILFDKNSTSFTGVNSSASNWGNSAVQASTSHVQSNPSAIFVPTAINGLANGRIWVAWHGKDATDSAKFNVRVSYSDDGGVTWATPVKLTSGNTYDRLNVSLAADKAGKVFALYEQHQYAPDLDIYMRTYNGSWGTESQITSDSNPDSNPSALVDYSLQMTTPPFVYTHSSGIKFSGNFNVGASVSPASGALGNKETATLTAYTVTPEAGSTVTQIVEKVNGVTVNTFNNPASLSRTLTVPTATWDTLAYFATHTASITVTDSNGAQTVTTYSFDKRLATGASLLEAEKANRDAKNRMQSQLDAISTRVGVANGSSTNQIISAIDSRNVVKRQNGTAVVSGGQIVVNTLGFLPKTITIRSSATQNGTYSELLGTNESRNGTTITQNAFTNITATGFTALISGTNVTWEAQG